MNSIRLFCSFILITALTAIAQGQQKKPTLAWDSMNKEYTAKLGETNTQFTFTVTNRSTNEIVIRKATTSCGCSVAKLPSEPWKLPPGTNGQVTVSVNFAGKYGVLMKSVFIEASSGPSVLLFKVNIPVDPVAAAMRTNNQLVAKVDRQAVFKNDCATCHAKPAEGKLGKALYASACAVCHEADHRATMVPDLHRIKKPDGKDYWHKWIAHGKTNSLMPAFAKSEGGPLTDNQITSLVEYVSSNFPSRPFMNETNLAAAHGQWAKEVSQKQQENYEKNMPLRLKMFDKNKDGKLDAQELAVEKAEREKQSTNFFNFIANYDAARTQALNDPWDKNKDGVLDEAELAAKKESNRQHFDELLKKYDKNGNGKLDRDEIKAMNADRKQ